MNETLETRIAILENTVTALTHLNFILFPLILQHDDRFRTEAAEVLRQCLVSPANPPSPLLAQYITALRNTLVASIPQEIVAASLQPSVRLVE